MQENNINWVLGLLVGAFVGIIVSIIVLAFLAAG